MEIVERRTVYIYIEEQNDEKPFFVLLLNNLAPNYDQYLYLSILSCMLTYKHPPNTVSHAEEDLHDIIQ